MNLHNCIQCAALVGRGIVAVLYLILLLPFVGAQVAGPYENTTARAIDDTVTCGSSSFTRTINVAESFTITDLDVGFLASHSWRGDIRVDLSHGGVTRRIISSDTSGAGSDDNYNVRLDDSAASLIRTAPHTGNDGLTAPPYENQVRPSNSLDVFNGQNGNGAWVFTICDDYNGADDGNFLRANLYFSAASPTDADMSFSLAASPPSPPIGSLVTLTATASNSGPATATGIAAQVNIPAGLNFVSASGGAVHSGGVVSWTAPSNIAASGSQDFTITATVNPSGPWDVTGEITAAGVSDPDSTPNNAVIGEDDYSAIAVVPSLTTPPSLTCGASALTHDWDSVAWPAGSLINSYTTAGETITWTNSGATSSLLPNPDGGVLPALSDYDTGGLSPTQNSLLLLADFPNSAASITTQIDVGVPGTGVNELQMAVFDVDRSNGGFTDQVTVTGFLDGVPVTPILTRSASNSVSGNVGTGTNGANNSTALGTITITFLNPVDRVRVDYGSGAGAPSNPSQQAISYHDVRTCPRMLAVLEATKTTEMFDPLSEGIFAIPGNDVIYTFTVKNVGTGPVDSGSLNLVDIMPSEVEYYNGDIDGPSGPELEPISFSQSGSPGLSLNFATDVRFSKSATKPANFAACTDTVTPGVYDGAVTFICFNPKGEFVAGAPHPEFQIKFRARIK